MGQNRSGHRLWKAAVVGAALLGVGASPVFAAKYASLDKPQYGKKGEVGGKIRNFFLPGVDGKLVALTDYELSPMKVLFFAGVNDAASNAYWDELNAMSAKFKDSGLQVIAIYSEPDATAEKVAAKVKEHNIAFPALLDDKQRVSFRYGIKTTPEVLVIDDHRVVRYRGRIDNQFAQGENGSATTAFLETALTEVASKLPVTTSATEPLGTALPARDYTAAAKSVTYSEHVSRILQDNCEVCHRAEGIGPMTFGDYKTAKVWGPMIKEVVLDDRMPPWLADPRTDHKWGNDRRLSQQEIDTLVSWIDGGMVEGDVAKLPVKKEYNDGKWTAGLGQPDYVFEIPQPFNVPATGSIPYQNFTVPTNFKEDVWVSAVETQPDNQAAVHHIIVNVRGGAPTVGGAAARGIGGGRFLDGTAPGDMPLVMRNGAARRIPAGSSLSFQLHYTATGKPEVDRSRIGLYVSKEPPKFESITANALNQGFRLPPNADNVEVVSQYRFNEDARLDGLMPHMHVRGKSFKYTAVYPDGTESVLLNVPQYDFNWQLSYEFADETIMPAGTVLRCVATFDNSVYNYANPDPTEEVRWGDQTWEEMMIGWFSYTSVKTIAERTALTNSGVDLTGPDQLQAAEASREAADAGRVQAETIVTASAQ